MELQHIIKTLIIIKKTYIYIYFFYTIKLKNILHK